MRCILFFVRSFNLTKFIKSDLDIFKRYGMLHNGLAVFP